MAVAEDGWYCWDCLDAYTVVAIKTTTMALTEEVRTSLQCRGHVKEVKY